MQAFIYEKLANHCIPELVAGLQAIGYSTRLKNPFVFDGPEPNVDLVVVHGIRPRTGGAILRAYQERGVPVQVLEQGYWRRAEGYRQYGEAGINVIPNGPCPIDRAQTQGLIAGDQVVRQDGYVLAIGQVRGDMQIPEDCRDSVNEWIRERASEVAERYGCRWVYRPHPMVEASSQTLADALAGARAVVTCTSTTAYEAMVGGIPVVCHADAVYTSVCREDITRLEVQGFLNRVAYGQWLPDEFARGLPWGLHTPETRNTSSTTAEGATPSPSVAPVEEMPKRKRGRPRKSG
jgi:hypothetical protein